MQKINEKISTSSSNKRIRPEDSRMIVSLYRLMLLWLFCAALFPAKIVQADTLQDETLTAIEKKYAHMGFQADFTQISKLAALDITETASGKAWFSHPGKMRWLYLSPERHEIITNGTALWIYRPGQAQVMKGDAKKFFKSGAGGAFLSDIALIRKNFSIQIKEATDTHVTLVLTAKQKSPDLVSILIRVSRFTHEIEQATTQNTYGDSTVFEFTHIQFGQMDASTFEFTVPEGSSVIEMDEN